MAVPGQSAARPTGSWLAPWPPAGLEVQDWVLVEVVQPRDPLEPLQLAGLQQQTAHLAGAAVPLPSHQRGLASAAVLEFLLQRHRDEAGAQSVAHLAEQRPALGLGLVHHPAAQSPKPLGHIECFGR